MNVNQKKLLRTLLAELHKRNVLCTVEVAHSYDIRGTFDGARVIVRSDPGVTDGFSWQCECESALTVTYALDNALDEVPLIESRYHNALRDYYTEWKARGNT